MKILYQDYFTIMENKILIGVKAGINITPLEEVKEIVKWNPSKKGMMLWTLNRDTTSFTKLPDWTYTTTIINLLDNKKQEG